MPDHPDAPQITIRRARPGDEAVMVTLRAQMFVDMGWYDGDPEAAWRASCETWFAYQLANPSMFAAFVGDDPELGVVSMAAGLVATRAPGPRDPAGRRGHLFNVATRPDRRRLGLARACVTALLVWFETQTPVTMVDLNANEDGESLYREMGFGPPVKPPLQLRIQR